MVRLSLLFSSSAALALLLAAADIRRGLMRCARELGGMTEAAAQQHYNRLGWYGIWD